MKLFINARFLTQPISGVQRYGIECSRQIKKLYPETVFLSPVNILHTAVAAELGVTVLGSRTGQLWEQIDLPAWLRRHGSPVLLNLANTAPLFYSNNYVCIHDLAFFHHPEWNSKLFSLWYNFLLPRLACRSKHIFTVSNTIKGEIEQYYNIPGSKISVTYNGISEDWKRKGGEKPLPREKIILTVGTFNLRKNQQNLVKAFLQSEVRHTHRLVLIGDRNKIFSDSGIEHVKETENITILERLSGPELKSWYQRAEMVVSLSGYEGFGIPVLEGLYFGCKILCSDIPVYRELFKDVALFCPPYNVPAIARQLELLAVADSGKNENAISVLLEKYTYEQAAKVILKAIDTRQARPKV